jgi:TPP-dependent pyruvate/acetoin dehydrogenase alpha subunit
VDRTERVALLEQLVLVREFETRAGRLFAEGEITGSLHLSIGQEAVAVGVCAALRQGDFLTSTHRGHHHCLARGADPALMFAELFGRRDGYCGGRGGSMHIADAALGILGANGIVAAGIPIATGAALACQVRGEGNVAVAFFGEGATGEGAFHEGLNLARVWQLPAVFVCENNGFAEMMPAERHMPSADVANRGTAYDMHTVVVDGNDVEAVYAAAGDAVGRARNGEGPTLLEAKTHRWRGHYEGDPQKYRTAGVLDEWRERDPVDLQRRRLEAAGLLDGVTWDEVLRRIGKTIDAAVEFARESPWPDASNVATHTYGVRA